MKIMRSGNGFVSEARNVSKRFPGGSKTKYSAQSEKWLARNENKAFWQWFWARSQKYFKTALWRLQGPEIRFRAKNRSRAMKMDRQID